MYFQSDWLMRQIEMITQFVLRLLFDRETADEKLEELMESGDHELIWGNILAALRDGRVNEAENLLFENADPGDEKFVAVGLEYYKRLSSFSVEQLEAAGFTQDEVLEGLFDFLKIYGVDPKESGLL